MSDSIKQSLRNSLARDPIFRSEVMSDPAMRDSIEAYLTASPVIHTFLGFPVIETAQVGDTFCLYAHPDTIRAMEDLMPQPTPSTKFRKGDTVRLAAKPTYVSTITSVPVTPAARYQTQTGEGLDSWTDYRFEEELELVERAVIWLHRNTKLKRAVIGSQSGRITLSWERAYNRAVGGGQEGSLNLSREGAEALRDELTALLER